MPSRTLWQGVDRRRFPRVNLKCEILIRDSQGSRFFRTVTENVGPGGVCVVLEEPLLKFSMVSLRLRLEERIPFIECLGKVVWMVPSRRLDRKEEKFDTGIEFINLSEASRSHILSLITRGASPIQTP